MSYVLEGVLDINVDHIMVIATFKVHRMKSLPEEFHLEKDRGTNSLES